MKGNGNGLSTLLQKLLFKCLPTSNMRSMYIYKHKEQFHHIGINVKWQPRLFPADPELISIGDNVKIAANVSFVNHDITSEMLNIYDCNHKYEKNQGCIKVGNNVMIGAGTYILPNVQIGNNCIIGAGSIVTRDIPDNSVAVGIPCRVVGSFSDAVSKSAKIHFYSDPADYWCDFENQRRNCSFCN